MRWWLIIFTLFTLTSYAQSSRHNSVSFTLQSVAILSIVSSSSSNIEMKFQVPNNAGLNIVAPGTNTQNWLNFTSALATGSRIIYVNSSTSIPSKYKLMLEVTGPLGSGGGSRGTSSGTVEIGNSLKAIISGIGGAYTGVGPGNGFQLKYTASIQQFSGLIAGNTNIHVVYTLSDL
jgi:hypothetical protein